MSLVAFFFGIAREIRAQKDMRLLEQLDDTALKDIGLNRSDIERLVREHHGPAGGDTLWTEDARMELSRSGHPSRSWQHH